MKKPLLLIFIFISLFAHSQTWFPIGAKWYYTPQGEGSSYITMEVIRDTLIEDKASKILEIKNNDGSFSALEFVSLSRDSIFYFNQHTNELQLLYDFSAQKGDTVVLHKDVFKPNKGFLLSYENLPNFKYIVDSVDTFWISGLPLRRSWVSNILDSQWGYSHYQFGIPTAIIEKIGATTYFFGTILYIYPEMNLGLLRCYQDSEISYQNPNWDKPCDYITSTNQLSKNTLQLSPNPTTGVVYLNNLPAGLKTIQVLSLQGAVLREENTSATTTELDLSTFPSGVYFITLSTPTGEVFTGKIVKQ